MDRLADPGTPDDPSRACPDAPPKRLLEDLAHEVRKAAELLEQLNELLDAATAETRRLREITEAIDRRVQRGAKLTRRASLMRPPDSLPSTIS